MSFLTTEVQKRFSIRHLKFKYAYFKMWQIINTFFFEVFSDQKVWNWLTYKTGIKKTDLGFFISFLSLTIMDTFLHCSWKQFYGMGCLLKAVANVLTVYLHTKQKCHFRCTYIVCSCACVDTVAWGHICDSLNSTWCPPKNKWLGAI